MTEPIVFIALTEDGAGLARKLATIWSAAEVHGYEKRIAESDVGFAEVRTHLSQLYVDNRPIVAIMSVGIVTRILAPLLIDKYAEPPVICVAENGSSVVPLLGGHRGANEIATGLAKLLNVVPAITTAGELHHRIALDNPPPGWRCSNQDAAKDVMAALLAGKPIKLLDDAPPGIDRSWLPKMSTGDKGPGLRITARRNNLPKNCLVLHPEIVLLGVGCERGADPGELRDLVDKSMSEAGLHDRSIACVATVDLKEDEPAVRELAELLDVPLRLFSPENLEAETPRVSEPSDIVFDAVGTHSVAEAAALLAGGKRATLALTKQKGKRTTCAIATTETIVDPLSVGRGCGELRVVGVGPGQSSWRAPEATNAISTATDIVGYSLYIDLVGRLVDGKTVHAYSLGEERDRVIAALELASSGATVALVCSGDAGIYAMAALVYELIDRGNNTSWRRLDVRVVPGISALQAAAARVGAPLGHDFCTISLSDLLTSWEAIETRLRAASEGDFVVALYNPVSKRRQRQLTIARDILLNHRPPDTPVVIARNLGREGEQVTTVPLSALSPDQVDMLTLVIVGSSETTSYRKGDGNKVVYTPRGYREKGGR